MVATTYFLTKKIGQDRPQLIIQAGIAGSFTDQALTSSVVIKEDCFADLGVMEENQFKSVFNLGLSNPDHFPFNQGLLKNPYAHLMDLTNLDHVKGITINEISTDKNRIDWHQQHTGAMVETMEGAAFHYVCLQEKIPFLQIRSISNKVGERDKKKWEIKKSIECLNEQLILLLEKIDAKNEI